MEKRRLSISMVYEGQGVVDREKRGTADLQPTENFCLRIASERALAAGRQSNLAARNVGPFRYLPFS